MRSTEWTGGKQPDSARKQASHAMHLRGLDGLLKCEWRKDTGKSLGQHGLARARRTNHQYVVSPSGGDFQGALGSGLAANFAEVRICLIDWNGPRRCGGCGLKLVRLVQI